MAENIKIWQIYYRAEHTMQLDSAFVPLDNSSFADESLEFAVFQRLAKSGNVSALALWGALSWRFGEKTGLSGQGLLAAIAQQPDVDVFYMNPFPHNEALHVSTWWQGETTHPDFLTVSEAFCLASGLPAGELHRMTPSREFASCNYLVARPGFWAAYLDFVEQALAQADAKMPADLRVKLHSADADWRGIHHAATYVPFIVERLFTVFMRSAGRHFKAHKIPSPAGEARMNAALREMREVKDVAILSRSTRLLASWQEQRRAYFETHHGKDWCTRNLEKVMASPVRFCE